MKRIAMLLGAAALVLAIVPSTLAAAPPSQSIVQIATANGNFKTLLAAVGCADPAVGKALTSGQQLTVFAPTDAAFGKLGLTPTNVCTALPKATLTKILLYHVVSGDAYAANVLPAAWGTTTPSRPSSASRSGPSTTASSSPRPAGPPAST